MAYSHFNVAKIAALERGTLNMGTVSIEAKNGGTDMRVRMFQVDAFSERVFGGNPAAVLPLESFPDDATMLAIAAENNLSETAFLVRDGAEYRLRWFTPRVEVPLCGHGTLASAAVVMERLEPERRHVEFSTLSGPLTVERTKSGYVMNLPVRLSERVAGPVEMSTALGVQPSCPAMAVTVWPCR